jgi:hypothetical protein
MRFRFAARTVSLQYTPLLLRGSEAPLDHISHAVRICRVASLRRVSWLPAHMTEAYHSARASPAKSYLQTAGRLLRLLQGN